MGKVVGIRPTEKARQIIDNYKREHDIEKDSKAVIEIIENFNPSVPSKLEQTQNNKDPNKPRLCPCEQCKHFFEPKDPLKFPDFIKTI